MTPPKMVSQIMDILNKQLSECGFIRHKDGDTTNNRATNLEWCLASEAFKHPEWTVDWTMNLNKKQIQFVRINMANFAVMFESEHGGSSG